MALDLPSIILQAGQMITESLRSAQQTQLQRERMKEQQGLQDETMKLRETKLKIETELASIKLEKEKALRDTAVSNATVATSTTGERIEQEKMQTSQGVLGLEKLNQDINFDKQMQPYRQQIVESNAELKVLEANAATIAGGAPDALSKQLSNINQRSVIQGRILTVAEDAGKLHVRRAGTRETILGNLGPQYTQKYGSREYGWFYAQREAITRALQTDNQQRPAALAAAGIVNADKKVAVDLASQQLGEINNVINSYEGEFSKFINQSVDLSQVPINLKEMARSAAMKTGTGPQTAGTFTQAGVQNADGTSTPNPAQTAPEVQLQKIATAPIPDAVAEIDRMAQDLSKAKGITAAAAYSEILNSITDEQRRTAILEELSK